MGEKSIALGKEELKEMIKEKYPNAFHVEIYIEYNDEGVEGNDQIIVKVNVEE